MKLDKKGMTIASFAIGACLFVTTAFADMALGTGYDRLKQTIKHTAHQMETGLGNFTMETEFTLEADGRTVNRETTIHKVDAEKNASENITTRLKADGETTTSYSYSDQTRMIWKSVDEDKYYVTEFVNGRPARKPFTNPFNERGAPELEKIFDALVGNLKDYVQVEETSKGGRIYSGSLSETQVPALVNAVSSFVMKQAMDDRGRVAENHQLPAIENDIFVKRVTGTAVETEQGLLESIAGNIVMSGKDKDGVEHEVAFGLSFKLSNVGTTDVIMPDLTGKVVEQVKESRSGFSEKHVGTYKNNIVIEKDGRYVKIGERVLEITSVEGDRVTGKYVETVKPEFADEYPTPYNFTFVFEPDDSRPMSFFTYTNANGEQEYGQLHPGNQGKLYLDLNLEITGEHSWRSNMNYDLFNGEFNLIFEE